ncbi:Gfo/Idh/MocA family oxidoreductase [Opitutia bacterium ISCC 51]|nr:Gfo/Idh/MocA family oxidoreductase [Opitutae bacterium ISCC 51]QXD29943.1 Gfo/Idh/MocA family oxidoreductase [Opitutae bacterium ISCC 52]
MNHPISRRKFVAASSAFGLFQIVPRNILGGAGHTAASEKLNIAGIGIGGMGNGNLSHCKTENIVALCDVDHDYAAPVFEKYSQAKMYTDYRVMLEKQKDIDAVVIATPDHTHAVIGMAALQAGKHVFLQKPLTHTVKESQILLKESRRHNLQTQMGNQGHSSEHIRLLKEWLDDGVIGDVTEVYAWTDRPVGGAPWSTFAVKGKSSETPPVPANMDWDLWLGPAQYRPYHPDYHPLKWRAWLDFGTGSLGDMGCHIIDPAFWALDLGQPETIEATSTHWEEEVSSQTYPRASICRYQFPARGNKPPVTLHWSDGRLLPPRPEMLPPEVKLFNSGALILGSKGVIQHGSHGAGGLQLYPESLRKSYQRPEPTIPRVKGGQQGHLEDWLRACKDGNPASSNFEYGAALTETVLLGVLAIRAKDQKLYWDSEKYEFTNNDEANALLHPPYREGWTI